MEMSEFLNREPDEAAEPEELDVQKAVVESLAADKAEQSERISVLQRENYMLKSEVSVLKEKIAEMRESLAKVGDVLSTNAEGTMSSKISLLDRNMELQDRFEGETRDHVLEVLRESREVAEKEGRLRRAQLLEAVILVNEPAGNLAKKRGELEKFLNENGNVLTGPVIDMLQKSGISYKNGEEYLLIPEIIKRTY